MGFNKYFLIYIIGVALSVAYNPSMASPPFGSNDNDQAVNVVKAKKQQRNPWAGKMPNQRDYNQQYLPRMPDFNSSRFITQEELDALNNTSAPTREPGYLHGWKPLPSYRGQGVRPESESKNPYSYQPYSNQYERVPVIGDKVEKKQWDNPSVVLPVDPMDPGRYGTPFDEPFRGIDSFQYE